MSYSQRLLPYCFLGVGVLVRYFLSFYTHAKMNWDEAPQALMARQIAEGRLFPVVHFQLPYIGAVEQYPLALFMLVLGDDVNTLRVFYFLLSVLSLFVSFLFFRRFLPGNWAGAAVVMTALCTPMILLSSMQAYSFAGLVFFTGLVLWASCDLGTRRSLFRIFALGVVSGLALYNNILFVGVLLFCGWSNYRSAQMRGLIQFVAGVVLGYLPMLVFNLFNEFVSYRILVAKLLQVTQGMVDETGIAGALVLGLKARFAGGASSSSGALFTYPAFFSDSGYWVQASGFWAIGVLVLGGFMALLPRISHYKGTAYETRIAFYASSGVVILAAIGEIRYLTALIPIVPVMVCDGLIALGARFAWISYVLGGIIIAYLAS